MIPDTAPVRALTACVRHARIPPLGQRVSATGPSPRVALGHGVCLTQLCSVAFRRKNDVVSQSGLAACGKRSPALGVTGPRRARHRPRGTVPGRGRIQPSGVEET